MDNSSGYLNTLLFLGYLFVAIFIMLSMFLAILAEAQVAVREDEAAKKKEEEDFNECAQLLQTRIVHQLPRIRPMHQLVSACTHQTSSRPMHQLVRILPRCISWRNLAPPAACKHFSSTPPKGAPCRD